MKRSFAVQAYSDPNHASLPAQRPLRERNISATTLALVECPVDPIPTEESIIPALDWSTRSYQGPHPFFVDDREEGRLGPLSYADMTACVFAAPDPLQRFRVSAGGERWLSLIEIALLTGQEEWLRGVQPAPSGGAAGSLADQPLVSILARLERRKVTGRLILIDDASQTTCQRREIHLVDGAPTFVFSDHVGYALPKLLVDRGLVASADLEACIYNAVREHRFIDVAANDFSGVDVAQHWPLLMKDRLGEILSWRSGSWALDLRIQPIKRKCFTQSLLATMVELVARTEDPRSLHGRLAKDLDVALVPSERHAEQLATLRFSAPQLRVARDLLLERKTVRQLLSQTGVRARDVLAVASVLLGSGLALRLGGAGRG